MHPTIDEQLSGAKRLLDLAEDESQLSATSAEALTNARRLLTQVQRSWSALLPFYLADNARLATLLKESGRAVEDGSQLRADDVVAQARRNAALRQELADVISGLPTGPDGGLRARIAEYLTARVDADPS